MPPLLRLLRPHQWSKNLLVFVSLLVGHQYGDTAVVTATTLVFASFCLAASGGYIVNDLMDLEDDRHHPRKRLRPLAAGEVSPVPALIVAALLIGGALALAATISTPVLACVGAYLLSTLFYSLYLKRKMMIDIVALAGLYTIRIIGGVAVVHAVPSFWLLGFAMFLFTSLATLKRYVELRERSTQALEDHSVRAYRVEELPVLGAVGVANGFLAVLVLAFYMNSAEVQALYATVLPLWLLCPLFMYWIGRTWLLASRGIVDSDPILFALRDRLSYAMAAAVLLLVFIAK
jgi:4-hydroxybenzoate polyprenyltransferase